jgi:drug/metabolite transporter (DMT)-like permease
VALVTYVEVPFGYALQLLILKEAPTAYQCAGSAVIVGACAAHTLLDTKKAH